MILAHPLILIHLSNNRYHNNKDVDDNEYILIIHLVVLEKRKSVILPTCKSWSCDDSSIVLSVTMKSGIDYGLGTKAPKLAS